MKRGKGVLLMPKGTKKLDSLRINNKTYIPLKTVIEILEKFKAQVLALEHDKEVLKQFKDELEEE